jgi:CDP-diacylglycerol--serine O-phosphatidyltransferase
MAKEQKMMIKTFMNWRQIVPTLFTLVAMLCGLLSILYVVQGFHGDDPEHWYRLSAKMIMLAMILDGLDGNVARWLKGTSEFGAELDTYVDMTAFGIAPAVLIFAVTMETQESFLRILLPSAVVLSGVVRLARFKVTDPLRGQGGYAGLPITTNAAWVSMLVYISLSQDCSLSAMSTGVFSLQSGWFALLFLVGILVFISLQVSNVRFPKPTKKTALFVPCVILVGLFVCLGRNQGAAYVAALMLVLGLLYVILGPLFVKGVEIHKARRDGPEDGSCEKEDA